MINYPDLQQFETKKIRNELFEDYIFHAAKYLSDLTEKRYNTKTN